MGFYQVAKYYYYPGWHEPGGVLEITINKEKFYQLPSDLQEIVINELPKPLLPEKNTTTRTEQGGPPTSGFNALEIDPETGRPIIEKEEEE